VAVASDVPLVNLGIEPSDEAASAGDKARSTQFVLDLMNLPQTKTLFIAALCATLAACGGGGDGASSPTTPAVATFADCFTVTPGVAYTVAGSFPGKILMVQEDFNGTVRPGMVDFTKEGSDRDQANYWSPEANGIRFWGAVNYNNPDHTASSRDVSSDGNLMPLNMLAGQTAALNYTVTTTYLNDGSTSTQAVQESFTFEGFETVTLGGKTFENVCRLKSVEPANTADGSSTTWWAKGFGLIHARHTDSAGTVDSETTLDTVTAQP